MGYGLVRSLLFQLLLLPLLLTLRARQTLLPAPTLALAMAAPAPVRAAASGSAHVRRFGPPQVAVEDADADAQIVNPVAASPPLTDSGSAQDSATESDANAQPSPRHSDYPSANEDYTHTPDYEPNDDPATTGKRLKSVFYLNFY